MGPDERARLLKLAANNVAFTLQADTIVVITDPITGAAVSERCLHADAVPPPGSESQWRPPMIDVARQQLNEWEKQQKGTGDGDAS